VAELVRLIKLGGLGDPGAKLGDIFIAADCNPVARHTRCGGLDALDGDEDVQELRLDRARVVLAIAVDKHERDNVVANVALALDLLAILRAMREWHERGHVEHDLKVSPLPVDRMGACGLV